MLKHIGVDSVKISPCIVSNDGAENNRYHAEIFDLVKGQVQRAIDDFADSEFEIFDSYYELDSKFNKDYTWCPHIQTLTVIGADLNVYTCQDKAYNLDDGLLGSIRDVRFKELWFSDKKRFFKLNPSVHCNHHCVANAANKLVLEYLDIDEGHREFA
jgi:hypothetical protein